MNAMKTNPSTSVPRDGIHVPGDFAADLAARASAKALSAQSAPARTVTLLRWRRILWTAASAAFQGKLQVCARGVIPLRCRA